MPKDAAARQLLLLKEILRLVWILFCGKASNTMKKGRFSVPNISTLKINNN